VLGAAPNGVALVAAPNGAGPLLKGVGVGAIPPPNTDEELVVAAPNGEGLGAIPPPKGDGPEAMPPNGAGAGTMPPPKGDALIPPPNGVGLGAKPPPNGDVLGALPKGVGLGAAFDPKADVPPIGAPPKVVIAPKGLGLGAATPNGAGAGFEPKADKGTLDPDWPVFPPNGEDVEFAVPNGLCPTLVLLVAPNGLGASAMPPKPPNVLCCDDPKGT
jgi:hypothetical protein